MSYAESVSYKDIDVKHLALEAPKSALSTNGKLIHLTYKKVKTQIVLSEMDCPYGAGNSEKFPDKYTMALSFQGLSEDSSRGRRLKKVNEVMHAIDDRLLELITQNTAMLFKDKGKPSKEIIASRYQSFIVNKNEDANREFDIIYASIKQRPIPKKEVATMTPEQKELYQKEFQSKRGHPLFVDVDGKPIECTVDNLKEVIPWNSRVKPVLEFAYLWVMGSTQFCHPVWQLVHGLRVSTSVTDKCLIRPDDDEENEEGTAGKSGEKVEEENGDYVEAEMTEKDHEDLVIGMQNL